MVAVAVVMVVVRAFMRVLHAVLTLSTQSLPLQNVTLWQVGLF